MAAARRRWLVLCLLCVAQFVDVLGVTSVVVALPSIRRDLALTGDQLQWVVSVYALFFGGFLIVCGRAADTYGQRRLFAAGLTLFGAASLGCGLAPSPVLLTGARALQGLGAALVVPAALALLTTTFSGRAERARAIAIWTAVAAGGGATGFVLGGVITAALGWRWVFFVNVPVVVASLALTPRVLQEDRRRAPAHGLDLGGAIAVTAGLLALIFSLTHAERAGLRDAETLGALALAAVLLAGFAMVERRAADPLVPGVIARSSELVAANATALVLTAVTSSAGVIGTLYAQQVIGLGPRATGLAFVPFSVAVVAGSSASPWIARRIRPRSVVATGLALVAVGMLCSARIRADGGLSVLIVGLSLSGFGLGTAAVASTSLGTGAAAPDRQGLASGLLNTSTQLGTALGIAVFITVAAARTDAMAPDHPSHAALVEGFRLAYLAAAGLAALAAVPIFRALRSTPAIQPPRREDQATRSAIPG